MVSEKDQDQSVSSSGYKLTCVDEQYSWTYKTYFSENVIEKCVNDMIKKVLIVLMQLKENLINLLIWLKKYLEDFKNFSKCWICKKAYEEGEVQ